MCFLFERVSVPLSQLSCRYLNEASVTYAQLKCRYLVIGALKEVRLLKSFAGVFYLLWPTLLGQ